MPNAGLIGHLSVLRRGVAIEAEDAVHLQPVAERLGGDREMSRGL